MSTISTDKPTDFDQSYTNYQLKRSKFRTPYLWNVKRYCYGPTLDLGCGIGDLLKSLPKKSVGLEINSATVTYCQSLNLPVELYSLEDNYQFKMFKPNQFKTLTCCHVLEHLENPVEVIKKIFDSATRLNIERIVLVVPGWKGYKSDLTHKTFITANYFRRNNIFPPKGWNINKCFYFPFLIAFPGRYFKHNELTLVFDRVQYK